MLHKYREFTVETVNHPFALARKLAKLDASLNQGFRYLNTLWLNDSTDTYLNGRHQEFAVVNLDTRQQIESITVSWCSVDDLINYIVENAGDGVENFFNYVLENPMVFLEDLRKMGYKL